jgi:hypothetical protein
VKERQGHLHTWHVPLATRCPSANTRDGATTTGLANNRPPVRPTFLSPVCCFSTLLAHGSVEAWGFEAWSLEAWSLEAWTMPGTQLPTRITRDSRSHSSMLGVLLGCSLPAAVVISISRLSVGDTTWWTGSHCCLIRLHRFQPSSACFDHLGSTWLPFQWPSFSEITMFLLAICHLPLCVAPFNSLARLATTIRQRVIVQRPLISP